MKLKPVQYDGVTAFTQFDFDPNTTYGGWGDTTEDKGEKQESDDEADHGARTGSVC